MDSGQVGTWNQMLIISHTEQFAMKKYDAFFVFVCSFVLLQGLTETNESLMFFYLLRSTQQKS